MDKESGLRVFADVMFPHGADNLHTLKLFDT